jgi:hypothetical protein
MINMCTKRVGENGILRGEKRLKKEDAGDYLMPVYFSARLPDVRYA